MVRVSAVLFMLHLISCLIFPFFAVQEKLGYNLIGSDFGQLHMCSSVFAELMDCRPCFLAILDISVDLIRVCQGL